MIQPEPHGQGAAGSGQGGKLRRFERGVVRLSLLVGAGRGGGDDVDRPRPRALQFQQVPPRREGEPRQFRAPRARRARRPGDAGAGGVQQVHVDLPRPGRADRPPADRAGGVCGQVQRDVIAVPRRQRAAQRLSGRDRAGVTVAVVWLGLGPRRQRRGGVQRHGVAVARPQVAAQRDPVAARRQRIGAKPQRAGARHRVGQRHAVRVGDRQVDRAGRAAVHRDDDLPAAGRHVKGEAVDVPVAARRDQPPAKALPRRQVVRPGKVEVGLGHDLVVAAVRRLGRQDRGRARRQPAQVHAVGAGRKPQVGAGGDPVGGRPGEGQQIGPVRAVDLGRDVLADRRLQPQVP